MADTGLVYVGKVICIEEIERADFIVSATVICGEGGKWKGIVRKNDFFLNAPCVVFLPDSQLNEIDHAHLGFMKDTDWRVKMRRFRGSASEVLITPHFPKTITRTIGFDCTEMLGITKYHKPVPEHLQGKVKGDFPSFIPKTDEPNYQNEEGQQGIEKLIGKAYYITEKADGSSTTAFKYKGQFGLCSRNWELERDENIGYWKIAIDYKLEERLPEGYALQWETVGPKIQGNPMGLKKIQGMAFSAYNIYEKKYLGFRQFYDLCKQIDFPTVYILKFGDYFEEFDVSILGEGKYLNGKEREGVVIRSQHNLLGHKPISFKVINLNYEK